MQHYCPYTPANRQLQVHTRLQTDIATGTWSKGEEDSKSPLQPAHLAALTSTHPALLAPAHRDVL